MTSSPDPLEQPTPPGTIDVPVTADSQTSFTTLSSPNDRAAPAGGSPFAQDPDAPPRPRRLVGPRRQLVIIFGITSSLLISALAIGLLYAKWYKAPEYDTTIIVWGEPDWAGAKVTVQGSGPPDVNLWGELWPSENMLIRFHVPPGDYRVRVVKDGRLLAERGGRVLSHAGVLTIWWPFRRPPAATQIGAQ